MGADSKHTKTLAAESREKTGGSFFGTFIRFAIIALLAGFMLKPYLFKTAETPKTKIYAASGETMGTAWNATVCVDEQTLKAQDLASGSDLDAPLAASDEERLGRYLQRELDAVDLAASTFKPESDVSRFNASRSTDWFPVSETTAQIVKIALDVAQKTGGAFDPTVAPLVDLYRFGPNKAPLVSFPTDEQIAKLRERVGYDKLEVRLEPEPGLRKTIPELTLDLSGVAKGFAVDRVAQALEKAGLTDYLVEVGGETRCCGSKKRFDAQKNGLEETPWRVGIEAPEVALNPQTHIPRLYEVLLFDSGARPDASLATSGDYRNFLPVENLRISHILDPRSGKPTAVVKNDAPVAERLGSVSVVAENCAEADAFATAFFVLGEKEGIALADRLDLAVLYLFRADDSAQELRRVESQAFKTKVALQSSETAPAAASPAETPQSETQSDGQ